MHIKDDGNTRVMSTSLVCSNYSDMKHFHSTFEKIGDNEYKCDDCDAVMVVKEPVLIHDDKGRLEMQVSAESKQYLCTIEGEKRTCHTIDEAVDFVQDKAMFEVDAEALRVDLKSLSLFEKVALRDDCVVQRVV